MYPACIYRLLVGIVVRSYAILKFVGVVGVGIGVCMLVSYPDSTLPWRGSGDIVQEPRSSLRDCFVRNFRLPMKLFFYNT